MHEKQNDKYGRKWQFFLINLTIEKIVQFTSTTAPFVSKKTRGVKYHV